MRFATTGDATVSEFARALRRPWLRQVIAAALLLAPAGAGVADHPLPTLTPAQSDFVEARRLLRSGAYADFTRKLSGLEDHLLYPFLAYEFLRTRTAATPASTLRRFMVRYDDAYVSALLRKDWLRQLARDQRWETFLAESDGVRDVELLCRRLSLVIEREGITPVHRTGIETTWLAGRSRPRACDPLFAAWERAGGLTPELVWKRIELALAAGEAGLARYLGDTYLVGEQRTWARRWVQMHRQPRQRLGSLDFPLDSAQARELVRYGVARLARSDPAQAEAIWSRLRSKHRFTGADDDYVMRAVGLQAAFSRLPQAERWLAQVSPTGADRTAGEWRVRAALAALDWEAVEAAIAALDDDVQAENGWRYWKARALQARGHSSHAEAVYRELAAQRNYYSFLAADRIGAAYAMLDREAGASSESLRELAARTPVRMALELRAVDDSESARRQWNRATETLSREELQLAALVAHDAHWHDQAIITAARAGYWDDLGVRFPLLYRDVIAANAGTNRIAEEWVYGVIRQESAFAPDARSSVGALGLMQLMPKTARRLGKSLNLRVGGASAVMEVDTNIRLGTAYLRQILDESGGNPVLATASYNAGPHRVRQWLPTASALDADIWVEIIPFKETRNFVKNVLAFTAVYEHRLGRRPGRLRQRMPPVTPHSG